MKIHVELVSTSLNAESRSRALLMEIGEALRSHGADIGLVDARSLPQVLCDGRDLEAYPADYAELYTRLEKAQGVVIAQPIYLYSTSGPSKNLVDIVGEALADKPVAIVSAAGSMRSHLAVRDLMCSLLFEHGVFIYPHTVQLAGEEEIAKLGERLDGFAEGFVKMVAALAGARE